VTDRDDSTTTQASERPEPALDPAAAGPDPGAESDSGGGDERPEILVAGAFLGGLVVALVLKRVARG
jgi:hypothetical protein